VPAPRFFVEQALSVGACVTLPARVAHHARNVLRLRAGDPIVLFNGAGGEYRARLTGAGAAPALVQADVVEFDPVEREARIAVTLIQALATSDKIDWVVEKAVEIGVARVIVAATARSAVQLDGARRERRLQHWRELVIAACCQCARNRLVPVLMAPSLGEALEQARDAHFKCILDPAAAHGLPPAPPEARGAAVAVGPEGGFDFDELRLAAQSDFVPVSLGPRILRTETAGLAAATAWFALNGEYAFGPSADRA
jgi:16S rRNA (uracil1498-N3)-methyltransferase